MYSVIVWQPICALLILHSRKLWRIHYPNFTLYRKRDLCITQQLNICKINFFYNHGKGAPSDFFDEAGREANLVQVMYASSKFSVKLLFVSQLRKYHCESQELHVVCHFGNISENNTQTEAYSTGQPSLPTQMHGERNLGCLIIQNKVSVMPFNSI